MFDHSTTRTPSDAVVQTEAIGDTCPRPDSELANAVTTMDPYTANTRKAVRRLRFPWFRRALAPFGLVSTVIIVGITAAALTVIAFMGVLFLIEQAVG